MTRRRKREAPETQALRAEEKELLQDLRDSAPETRGAIQIRLRKVRQRIKIARHADFE